MDLGEHKASEADKTWIANFGDSIRTMSISQPVWMSITARLFQGQVQACQPNFDLHESPFWWLIYDVFLCFCALLILYLCLFYCNWFLVLNIFEIWSSTCCVLLLLLFEVWRWKPSHSRIASEPALAGKKPTCWRQQRSSSFTAMETSFTRSTSAEIDKNAIEGPHALTVLHYILVTPDYSDDLARQRQNTHLNTKVTSVVPSVSKTPKSETWFMWRLGSRIQFTSIYPRMLVGLCLSWTILIIS